MYRGDIVKIIVTNRCNMNCKYCYEGEKKKKDLMPDNGKQALEAYIECYAALYQNIGSIPIVYHGGEPLIQFSLIKELTLYAIKKVKGGLPGKCDFSLTTNGLLLTDEMVDFFKKYHFKVSISIDGVKENHDKNRVDYNGNGTYEKVIASAYKLKEALGDDFSIRMTVTNDTISSMTQNVESFVEQGFQYINIALDYFGKWDIPEQTIRMELRKLERFYLDYTKRRKLCIDIFNGKIPLLQNEEEPAFCNAGFEEYVLDADGTYYPCFYGMNKGFTIGSISEGISQKLRAKRIREAIQKENIHFESCNGCEADKFCHCRKCGFLNYDTTGYLNIPNPILCIQEKELFQIVQEIADEFERRESIYGKINFSSPAVL